MPNIRLRKITEEDIENLPAFPDERDTIGKDLPAGAPPGRLEASFAEHKNDRR